MEIKLWPSLIFCYCHQFRFYHMAEICPKERENICLWWQLEVFYSFNILVTLFEQVTTHGHITLKEWMYLEMWDRHKFRRILNMITHYQPVWRQLQKLAYKLLKGELIGSSLILKSWGYIIIWAWDILEINLVVSMKPARW